MHLPKPFAPLLYSLGIQVIPAHILEPVWKAGNFNHTWGIDTPPAKIDRRRRVQDDALRAEPGR